MLPRENADSGSSLLWRVPDRISNPPRFCQQGFGGPSHQSCLFPALPEWIRGSRYAQPTCSRLQGRELPEAAWVLEIPSGCFDSALQIVFVGDRVVALRST